MSVILLLERIFISQLKTIPTIPYLAEDDDDVEKRKSVTLKREICRVGEKNNRKSVESN
jgi:hypothetical protein